MKPVQADKLMEETLLLENADLYYRPVYAFEYKWQPRDKSAVVEIDGATGQMRQAPSLLHEVKGVFTQKDAWFDITADTVGMLVPGANIAMKVGRVVVQHQMNKGSQLAKRSVRAGRARSAPTGRPCRGAPRAAGGSACSRCVAGRTGRTCRAGMTGPRLS